MIKYRVIQKAQPGVAGGGEKKYYASIALDGEARSRRFAIGAFMFSSPSHTALG